MKKYLSALTVLTLVGLVNASTINVESGWNLISTAGTSNVSTSCILNQLPEGSIIWSFDNYSKKWLAKSNSDIINSAISNHLLQFVENVNSTQGFWLNNAGGVVAIDMNCANIPMFTFGTNLSYTAYEIFNADNIFFDVSEGDGYDKIIVNSQTNITDKRYEFNGTDFILQDTMDINITINSDNNFSYSITGGERGDIIINEIKEIVAVDDVNVSGLKYISVTSYITQEGEGFWDLEGWQPTYYDDSQNKSVQITDIVTFKNQFIDPNGGYWNGEPDNNVWMFAESNDTTVTSGNVVRAQFNGYWENCTPSNEYDCKKFIRTNEVIGQWSLQNDILTVNLSDETIEWKFNNGQLFRKEIEKIGSKHDWFWLWSDNPTDLENTIRSN